MTSISKDSVKDNGTVRFGGGMKKEKPATASVKDSGKVRFGGGMKRRPA
ncbi:MAG TPA: hypothetical protein VD970_10390 [Acetobacteraceae bacterium]|nr:hypothetical protein [Acetobacteraceae bacterium]